MYKIKALKSVRKQVRIPADKSISHRAIILSSLCNAETSIKPFLPSDDTLATLKCMKKLGVKAVLRNNNELIIKGAGMYFPKKRKVTLYAHESGTTFRILSGVCCAQKFPIEFTAAAALNKRPMKRIVKPLSRMGAKIKGRKCKKNIYPPLLFTPVSQIHSGKFKLSIASAQVKSAIMLASLYANGKTIISEPYESRDHTQRMLKLFSVKVRKNGKQNISYPVSKLKSPKRIFIPSDFSSAAFFIVLGLILPNSKILIKDVNVNPTRCGLLKVLKRMGAKITIKNKKQGFEPYADILVESSILKAAKVLPSQIPSMIDEVSILCVAAAFAKGKTIIKGVDELRVKETDRVASLYVNLKKAGVKVSLPAKNVISITGPSTLKPAFFNSFGDHRSAMSAIVLGSALRKCTLDDIKCINKSFPQFISLMASFQKKR